MGLDVTIWEEKDFLPEMDGHGLIEHGACESTSGNVEESRGTHKVSELWCMIWVLYLCVSEKLMNELLYN